MMPQEIRKRINIKTKKQNKGSNGTVSLGNVSSLYRNNGKEDWEAHFIGYFTIIKKRSKLFQQYCIQQTGKAAVCWILPAAIMMKPENKLTVSIK